MRLIVSYYGVGLFASAIVAGAVAVIAWKRTVTPVGRVLGLLMTAVFTWAMAAAFEAAAPDQATKVLLAKIEFLGIAATPVLVFLFATGYSRSGSRLKPLRAAALWIIPAATVALAVTNEAHGLVWSGFSTAEGTRAGFLVYHHGPFFWVHAGYSYLLLFATAVALLLAFFRFKGVFRRQALLLLLAFPLPWAANALYLAGLAGAERGYDFTPVGFACSGFFLIWAMFRLRLVDIVPVAQERVIESMGESLIIVDRAGRLTATNPAARRLMAEAGGPPEDIPESKVLGRPAAELFPGWPALAAGLGGSAVPARELAWVREGGTRYFDLRLTPVVGPGAFNAGQVAILYDITRIKNAETSAVAARRVAETLREAGVTLSSNLDFKQITSLILELLKRVIPYDIGAFMTVEGNDLKLAAIKRPSDTRSLIGETYPLTGSRLCHVAIQKGRPLISAITGPDDILLPFRLDKGAHSFLGVPIVFRDRAIGLIALYNFEAEPFSEDAARVAELFASQAAIALDNSRRIEQMELLAVTDQLTGLYNRRAFAGMAAKEVGRSRRYRRPLALILFDIDHFKAVNDTHGHPMGDQVLQVLTRLVSKTIRATDVICRYGGDEFLVLMPEAGREEALAMAERLREEISRMTVVTPGGTLTLTVSLGVADLDPAGDEDIDGLINRADRAMYQAKAAGRGQVRG
ncbi:MAG TPA: histidine kinase N-terminal 7TM domain-containing protein [Candidatus Aminicenantes bacterium]|nr:histidine kinase N-terminal 7TM domain-containing protein [Candidatus Aminicenantes bacterium]